MLKRMFKELDGVDFGWMYLAAFGVFLFAAFIDTTMIRSTYLSAGLQVKSVLPYIEIVAMIIAALYALFFTKYRWRELILALAVVAIGFLTYYYSKNSTFLWASIMVVCAKGVDLRKVVALFFFEGAILTVVAALSAALGFSQMLIYTSSSRATRYAFGSIYPTDFCAHIFFLLLALCYLRSEHLNFLDILIDVAAACFCIRFCDARNSAACIILLALVTLFIFVKRKFRGGDFRLSRVGQIVVCALPCVCVVVALVLTAMYDPGNLFLSNLNASLSDRLRLGFTGFQKYAATFFGQVVKLEGRGGTTTAPMNYFYLDSSYVLVALRFGWVALVAACSAFTMVCVESCKRKSFILPLLIVLVFVHCMVEQHFIDLSYNVFLIAIATVGFCEKACPIEEDALDGTCYQGL